MIGSITKISVGFRLVFSGGSIFFLKVTRESVFRISEFCPMLKLSNEYEFCGAKSPPKNPYALPPTNNEAIKTIISDGATLGML